MIPNRNTHPLTKNKSNMYSKNMIPVMWHCVYRQQFYSASESYLNHSILYKCVDSNIALASYNIGKPIILTQLCMPAYPMPDAPIANHSLTTRLKDSLGLHNIK